MDLRTNVVTLKQMTCDTFRQACASGIWWMMLTVTAICVVLCLSVSVSGDVSLQGGDEPVLFLPQSTASTAVSRATADQTAGTSIVPDPDAARRGS